MKKYMDALGKPAKDKVTGFEGVIASVCFDLFGCVQYTLLPPVDKEGKQQDGHWYDANRIEITNVNPVMKVPTFESSIEDTKGPLSKPKNRF